MQQEGNPAPPLKLLGPGFNVALMNPERTVFEAMLDGWRKEQQGRGLGAGTISKRLRLIRRFSEFADTPPWRWRVKDVNDFTDEIVAAGRTLSTVRQYHDVISIFCDYLISPHYDWREICDRQFGEVPAQVCLPWNTLAHRYEYEGDPARRPLSYDEVQILFDTADGRVEKLVQGGKKGALAALRDAQLLKTVYAFGLRRREAVMLDLTDLRHNPSVPKWGPYGALHVRWAKGVRGGGPRRRTVLLVPEFDWWIDGMKQWVDEARQRFAPEDAEAIWVTERRKRLTLNYLDDRFAALRDEAGLSNKLTLHCLRHSYVTHLIEFGYAERFVQEQVGHDTASSTAIYASVSSDFKNRVLAKALKQLIHGDGADD